MNWFVTFMTSPIGCASRALAGGAVVAAGLFVIGGTEGAIVALAGVVPLAAGLLNICVLAPLFRVPFRGARIRRMR